MDPTKTTQIRLRFIAEVLRRFRRLARAVQEFIAEVDVLGLQPILPPPSSIVRLASLPQPRQYAFLSDPAKLLAFQEWFKAQVEQEIFRTVPGGFIPPRGSMADGPWMRPYIESAYKKGMLNAFNASKKSGVQVEGFFGAMSMESFLQMAFNQPVHQNKVEILASRAFEGMKGITADMAAEMNRILAAGMIKGSSVQTIAREMAGRIEGMTKARAIRIVRTEIIHAHAEGELDAFEAMGIDNVQIQAEWITAGDDRVCPQCAKNEGKKFTIQEARGLIPLHPNCRCSWNPIVVEKKRRKKRAA